MPGVGFDTFFPKTKNTKFVVRNITNGTPQEKVVRVFQYPIKPAGERDLLTIPEVSEADIRHALLKGSLRIKLELGELRVVDSNINLLQFDNEQKSFLQSVGITNGLEITAFGGGTLTDLQHSRLRQLIHLADGVGGPMEGFTSDAYRETLPASNPFPTSIIWWESSAKLKKIIEKTLTYDGSFNITTANWKVYDIDGTTVLAQITDTMTLDGPFELSRVRVIT